MISTCIIHVYLICNIICIECRKNIISSNGEQTQNKYKQLYKQSARRFKQWDMKTEEALGYPSGDKEKVAQVVNLWNDYYECTYDLAAKVTSAGGLPLPIQMVYSGSVARLPCGLCIAPDEVKHLVWAFTTSLGNFTYQPLRNDCRYVLETDANLTIYNTKSSDAGVYICSIRNSISRLIVLEVVDEEVYTTVKPLTSLGPYSRPSETLGRLEIYTLWSKWSQCSQCGRVGLRRRYGMCYVRMQPKQSKTNIMTHRPQLDNDLIFNELIRKLFEDFPEGIPCTSQHLPGHIREMNEVKRRCNEIMIGMCKVQCTNSDDDNEIIDKATFPTRIIIFAAIEQTLTLRCPGSRPRDMPITWRVGAKQILPNVIHKINENRVHVNERDHLILTKVKYSDTNLYRYSCWQRDKLVGIVKLSIWTGEMAYWNRYTALVGIVIAAGVLLRYAERTLRNTQRRLRIS